MVVKTRILLLVIGLISIYVLPSSGLAIQQKGKDEPKQRNKHGSNRSPASIQDGQRLSSPVAFTARYTSDWVLYEPGTMLQFPTVVYNTGEFDESTGVFTCPATGIYDFMLTVMLRELDAVTGEASAEIVSEGVVVGEAWFYDSGSGENAYVTCSTAAVVPCSAGGEVYVRTGATQSMIGGTASIEGTQFMGYLVTLL